MGVTQYPYCSEECQQIFTEQAPLANEMFEEMKKNVEKDSKLNKLFARRETMIAYLHLKIEEQDWHGVQDAASDLRDLDVELAVRQEKG